MMAARCIGLSLGLIGGIVAASLMEWVPPAYLLIALGAAGVLTSAYAYRQERRWREWPVGAILFASLLCGLPLGLYRADSALGSPAAESLRAVLSDVTDGTVIALRGDICHEPELRKKGQLDVQLRVNQIQVGDEADAPWRSVSPGKVLVRIYAQRGSNEDALSRLDQLSAPDAYGYRVQLSSRYQPVATSMNPGEFDYARFLRQGGLVSRFRCHVNRVTVIEQSRGNVLTELALLAKTDFLRTFRRTIRAPASRLVSAATLGTRRAVENISYHGKDIAKMFRHAGVGHVLAVSGLHVSVVTLLLYSLFRMAGMRPKAFAPPLIGFLVLFALLTGARPSSVRAVIMNAVVLITLAYLRCGLRRSTAIGLALSSAAILVGNPLILYAPSFLLSYGAVLSLVLIAPPVDRWLCTLRGLSLLAFVLWFAAVMGLASVRFHWLLSVPNLLGLAGLLWAGTAAGGKLNHRLPYLWRVGLDRVPTTLRMFLSAQLAIQVGMMIPMSAWFFGQIPVAGVFVNLVAIPLVGLVVQLGMLTGLLGLLPAFGPWVALPFGAAATVIGELFYRLAFVGASVFPFPATPRPTGAFMITYYLVISAILLLDAYRVPLLDIVFRRFPAPESSAPRRRRLGWAFPTVLILLPLLNVLPNRARCERLLCLASGRYPIVTLASSDGSAVVVNAGAGNTGERLLFDALRNEGASRVKQAFLCSADPRAGIEGCASLMRKMPIASCALVAMPKTDQDFLDAVGDDYLLQKAMDGQRWAQNYEEAFDELSSVARQHRMRMSVIPEGPLMSWRNGTLAALPRFTGEPDRYAASAKTPLLEATLNGLRWLIITDTSFAAVREALVDQKNYDVVIVSDLSSRRSFTGLLKVVLGIVWPRVLIISGENAEIQVDRDALLALRDGLVILETGKDGAVTATFEAEGVTRLETHLSGQSIALEPL